MCLQKWWRFKGKVWSTKGPEDEETGIFVVTGFFAFFCNDIWNMDEVTGKSLQDIDEWFYDVICV